MATHSSIFAWRIPMDRGAWRAIVHGVAESDKTEPLSTMLNIQMNKQVCPTRNIQAGQGERTSFSPVCNSAV